MVSVTHSLTKSIGTPPDGMLVYCRNTPGIILPFPIYTPERRETTWTYSFLSQETTKGGLEPLSFRFDTLTTTLLHLHKCVLHGPLNKEIPSSV